MPRWRGTPRLKSRGRRRIVDGSIVDSVLDRVANPEKYGPKSEWKATLDSFISSFGATKKVDEIRFINLMKTVDWTDTGVPDCPVVEEIFDEMCKIDETVRELLNKQKEFILGGPKVVPSPAVAAMETRVKQFVKNREGQDMLDIIRAGTAEFGTDARPHLYRATAIVK